MSDDSRLLGEVHAHVITLNKSTEDQGKKIDALVKQIHQTVLDHRDICATRLIRTGCETRFDSLEQVNTAQQSTRKTLGRMTTLGMSLTAIILSLWRLFK